jgi:protease-4
VGVLAILAVFAFAFVGLVTWMWTEDVEANTIVELDLDGTYPEWVPNDPIARALMAERPTVRDLVDTLDRAAEDDRVVGAFVRLGQVGLGIARVQELRDAIGRFRASGKPIAAWSDTFGEFGPGIGAYYLASACDSVTMQPSGAVGMTGLMAERAFRRGLYDKLDVEPELGQRYEYKTAMNVHTEKAFTDAERDSLGAVLDSLWNRIVDDVASDRDLSPEEVRKAVDRAPLIGPEAVDAGWVDRLEYRDEAIESLRERVGGGELLFGSKYLRRAGRPHATGRRTVGLVYGVGVVMRGANGYDPFTGTTTMGSKDVAAALRTAVDDRHVDAIVFRVDSPGGSYVASDTIWREVARARTKGKPVVVSMGDVAASGGYFVAMKADRIVAQPGTITASIGVLGGKLVTRGLWEKIGITFDETHIGRNAAIWSAQQPYTESGLERRDAFLDGVYEDFTQRVAEGRGLELDHVLEIARGRIWSGADALELGLVDELGGLDVAIRAAREAAGIRPDETVRIRVFPSPKSPIDALFGEGPDSSEDHVSRSVAAVFERLRPWSEALRRAGVIERDTGVLTVPEPIPRP